MGRSSTELVLSGLTPAREVDVDGLVVLLECSFAGVGLYLLVIILSWFIRLARTIPTSEEPKGPAP